MLTPACNGSGVHRIDVLDAELEVHAATKRELERSGAEPAPRSGSFLDHQLDAVALEIREALRRPLEQYPELEHLSVETQRGGERGDIQLRYEHQVRTLLTRGNAKMQASEVSRAVAAAMSIASALGLTVDDAIVLHNSNKLALRLLPV